MIAYPAKKCVACGNALTVHQVRDGVCDRVACRDASLKRWIAKKEADRVAAVNAVAAARLDELIADRPDLRSQTVSLLALPNVDGSLVEVSEARRDAFRNHLLQALDESTVEGGGPDIAEASKDASGAQRPASTVPVAVLAAACKVCQGACCRSGSEHAYLTPATITRVQAAQTELDREALLAAYLEAIPSKSVEGSCVFHGEAGCALPRDLRSNVCNDFFCSPLKRWLAQTHTGPPPVTAVVVVTRDLEVTRSVLIDADDGRASWTPSDYPRDQVSAHNRGTRPARSR